MRAATVKRQLVAAPSRMTTENFRLHMVHRHETEIGPENFTWDVEQPYRAMHRRMHATGEWPHWHAEEPPEAAIEFALQCLMENRLWGWREIAGTKGVVAAQPDGSWAVRFSKEIRYFNQVDHVASMMMKGKFTR